MNDLFINVLGTIIGGLLFTVLLFLLNEYVLVKRNLTGEWKVITIIEKSSISKYENLKIEFKVHLIQKGNEISGSGEKIKDILVDGTQVLFSPEKRVNIEIDGFFERKYLGKSKVYLNIVEEGRIRKSRTTYSLLLKNKNKIEGVFISTASDSSGRVLMQK